MSRLKIGVQGASGRMGKLVVAAIEASADLELAWGCGREGIDALSADVIVDFSLPEGFSRLMQQATCPVVSGTTGVIPPENPPFPLLHSPNFSLGIAVLARLVREAALALPGFDIEIIEAHHNAKKDAPSGTALKLARAAREAALVNGRAGPRKPGEIGIHAVRAGDIIGDHTVLFGGPGERLELSHRATHRGVFVEGALVAARWLKNKPPGRYTLDDLLFGAG
jgi:4-hydroxy-tetrahydrodipicolinate reductase